MINYWKTSLLAIVDMALPRHCVACNRPLYMFEKHLCLPCLVGLPLTRFETLSHNPMADRFNDVLERRFAIMEEAGAFESYVYATALFYYNADSDYRHITPRLKYYRDFGCGRYFADMLGQRILKAGYLQDVDAVVPVPLHWTRRWQRGYNQAEIIAKELVRTINAGRESQQGEGDGSEVMMTCRMHRMLKRRRRTRSQTALDVAGKAGNVLGAFALRRPYLPGKTTPPRHILLVDDVFTTGATLAACHAALRQVLPPDTRISVATLAFVSN